MKPSIAFVGLGHNEQVLRVSNYSKSSSRTVLTNSATVPSVQALHLRRIRTRLLFVVFEHVLPERFDFLNVAALAIHWYAGQQKPFCKFALKTKLLAERAGILVAFVITQPKWTWQTIISGYYFLLTCLCLPAPWETTNQCSSACHTRRRLSPPISL